MALTGRIGKLEDRTASVGTGKGIIADWALEYVRENEARLMTGRTGEIMRELGVSSDSDPTGSGRLAQHLSETYPNLDACLRGESQRAEKVHALLAPAFEESQQ